MRYLLFILALFGMMKLSAQHDSLNQRDAKGRLHGYWKAYLDSQAYPTDSANAYFYGLDLFDNGLEVFRYSNRNKVWRNYRFEFEGVLPQKGNPVPIHGTFKWFNPDNQLVEIETYKDGKPLFWESTQHLKSPAGATYKETLYFDRLYENTVGTFYWTEKFSDGTIQAYWFRKGKKSWKSFKIE